MHMIKYPKLLPWIASKANISHQRTQALWREAVCEVVVRKKTVENHDYPGIFERLHELIEQEKGAFSGQPATSFGIFAKIGTSRPPN
jgi:hypothetical protein